MPISNQELAMRAEALLFAEGDSLTYKKLAKLLGCDESTLHAALDTLAQKLQGSGLSLVRSDAEVALAVAPETRDAVAEARAGAEARDIGDAGLEVLGILLYEGPATRATIDYIRGVNSSSTIRTLLARGLVERTGNPDDGREYLYRAKAETLAHLGATDRQSLPEYATISRELASFKGAADVFGHGTKPATGDAGSPADGTSAGT